MSNRRKPRTPIPLDATPPTPVANVPWSDLPPMQYPKGVMDWIINNTERANAINVWVCEECGEGVVCVDRHPGVTPFMVSHYSLGKPECTGMAQSQFYNGAACRPYYDAAGGVPAMEWYRPSVGEFSKMEPAMKDHVMRGGLAIRPYQGA